jgi:small-conductance mechanosensitive channel
MSSFQSQTEELIESIAAAATDATPRLVLAALFLVAGAVVVRLATGRVETRLAAVAGNSAEARFLELLLRSVLWFGISLVALSLLGFQQLATALGTASGFLALAVAYGMREALSEAIAGLYLINDDRFVEGNRVSTDDETGVIEQVGLRRTKLRTETEGTVTVIANNRVEPKWTLHEESQG